MSDDNRLEESRLDADHIDRLTRELAAMQARAEKAEAVAELARRWLHCADVINETFGSHGPIKDYRLFSRQNADYMAAMDAMCAAIRQSKGTT